MESYVNQLYHKEGNFYKEMLENRMEEYGFCSLARMELCLWEREIFLQIQAVLGDRVALKGGTAVQFYLPKEVQRTSVDLDIVFKGTKEEIEQTLRTISDKLCNTHHLFEFSELVTEEPKSRIPLYTYLMKVPSVLDSKDLDRVPTTELSTQEIRIEFVLQKEIDFVEKYEKEQFLFHKEQGFHVYSLDNLYADTLTILGPNTIGMGNDRTVEQVKLFYDLYMMTKYHLKELDVFKLHNYYIKRAKQQCRIRKIEFDIQAIKRDVLDQLSSFANCDYIRDDKYEQAMDSFKSAYMNTKVEYTSLDVVCAASMIKFIYKNILECSSLDFVIQADRVANKLETGQFDSHEKGSMRREIREKLLRDFGENSKIPYRQLKGKDVTRVYWALINPGNRKEIEEDINLILSQER
ncbi:MAG: nucleotidyl transferase AbiEii/AbiGii toxin family protein [Mobilitalea sp.]